MLTPRAAVYFFFSLSLFLSHIYRRLHVCPHISSTREEDRREIRDAIDVFLLVWTLLHSKCSLIGDSWCVDLYLFTLDHFWIQHLSRDAYLTMSFGLNNLHSQSLSYFFILCVIWGHDTELTQKEESWPVYQWIHSFSITTYIGLEGARGYYNYCRVPEPIKLQRIYHQTMFLFNLFPCGQLFFFCRASKEMPEQNLETCQEVCLDLRMA